MALNPPDRVVIYNLGDPSQVKIKSFSLTDVLSVSPVVFKAFSRITELDGSVFWPIPFPEIAQSRPGEQGGPCGGDAGGGWRYKCEIKMFWLRTVIARGESRLLSGHLAGALRDTVGLLGCVQGQELDWITPSALSSGGSSVGKVEKWEMEMEMGISRPVAGLQRDESRCPLRHSAFCAPPGRGEARGLRTPTRGGRGRVSNPRRWATHPRSSIALWRRRRGRAVMTSVARRRCRRRCRAWPSSAPSPRSPSASRPPRCSRPCTRSTRGTSASTTGETARGASCGERAGRRPAAAAAHRSPSLSLSLHLPVTPQRRRVADLHQRARFPPHAALHHVLQVSAGAAGPGPGRGGHRGSPAVAPGWLRLCRYRAEAALATLGGICAGEIPLLSLFPSIPCRPRCRRTR